MNNKSSIELMSEILERQREKPLRVITYEGMKLPDCDVKYIDSEVAKAYEEMETHMEVFDLPSGLTLNLWCDGRYEVMGTITLKLY